MMKTIYGEDYAKAIEEFTSQQAAKAQESYSLLVAKLVGAFTIKYQVPVQSGAVSAISRIIKNLDNDGIRQIRAMSDALLQVDEKTLWAELEELQVQLLHVSAQAHQLKTKSAFISTVLRPFDIKFSKRWLSERKDIDEAEARKRIEDVERRRLESAGAISQWADDVLALFNYLVIYKGEEADQYYLRPAGTISPKSSRTYVQAWTAFIDKFADQVLEKIILGQSAVKGQSLNAMRPPDNLEQGLGQSVPDDMVTTLDAMVFADSKLDVEPKPAERMKTHAMSAPRAKSAWVKVLLESRADATAQASRKWDSQTTFQESLEAWLNSVGEIWGPVAGELSVKVSVKTRDGEAELTIPNVSITEAERKIIQTAALLQEN
jgi:hypothetical protein